MKHKEMCQVLRDLLNVVNPCLPKDQCMKLQNAWVRDSFKVQDNPMDFNVKLVDLASDFTLQVTFQKLPHQVFM